MSQICSNEAQRSKLRVHVAFALDKAPKAPYPFGSYIRVIPNLYGSILVGVGLFLTLQASKLRSCYTPIPAFCIQFDHLL